VIDDASRFQAWGSDGRRATTNDGGEDWTPEVLGAGDLLGGARRHDRMVLVGTAPSGLGPTMLVRDKDGDTAFDCDTLDTDATTVDQTELHETCLDPSALSLVNIDLRGVAPWRRNGFMAVGEGGAVIATRGNVDEWFRAGPADKNLCDTDEPLTSFTANLNDIARVGTSVLAVGDAGAVWLWRVTGDNEGAGCWEEVDLGSGFEGVDLYAVTADTTDDFMDFVPGSPDAHNLKRSASALIVGEDGVALRLTIRLDPPDDPGVDFDLQEAPTALLWTDNVSLHGVSSDDRSRIVVGDDNTVYTLPRSSDWTDASMWTAHPPPGSGTVHFRGVASDGIRYVAVGSKIISGLPIGVIYSGSEDVNECTLYFSAGDLDTTATVGATLAEGGCLPNTGMAPEATVWTSYSRSEPHLDDTDPADTLPGAHDHSPTWDDGELTWHIRLGPTPERAGMRGFQTTVLYDDTDTDADADDISYRLTLLPELGDPILHDLSAMSRVFDWPDPNPSNYPLHNAGDGAPVHERIRVRNREFVDVLTGFKVDPTAAFDNPARRGVLRGVMGPLTVDYCGDLPEMSFEAFDTGEGPYVPPGDPHLDTANGPTYCDDSDVPAGEACFPYEHYLSRMSRLRAGGTDETPGGHEYADVYEALAEGKQWRYQSMKHYLFGRCTGNSEGASEDWSTACCDVDALPTAVSLPLFAPMAGHAYIFPQPGEAATGSITSSNDLPGSIPANTDCGFANPALYPGLTHEDLPPSVQVLFVSEARDFVMLFDHVRSCLYQPPEDTGDPIDPQNPLEFGEGRVPVAAGDRLGEWSPHRTFDLVAAINDEADRWRLVSYFDVLPPELYRLHQHRLGLDPRGSGDPADPTISLKQRDQCPMRPVEAEADPQDTDEKVTEFDLTLDSGCVAPGASNPLSLPVIVPNLIEFP
jgi:hypothetical protein